MFWIDHLRVNEPDSDGLHYQDWLGAAVVQ